jgi:predicted CoA-binding protein
MFTNFEGESAMPETERDTIRHILQTYRTIATVGLSSDEDKPAYIVPDYLHSHGYRIIPVNPGLDEALGEKAYASLSDIPEPVEVVQVFLRSERVGPVVDEAVAIGARAVWMQLGIVDEEAAARARAAGLEVVMNQCMKVQHKIMTRG